MTQKDFLLQLDYQNKWLIEWEGKILKDIKILSKNELMHFFN